MLNIPKQRAAVIAIAKKPLIKRIAIGVLIFLVLFGLAGYFVLPGIIKSQAEKLITEKLHRAVSIEKVDVSPYAMAVTIHKLRMMEPDGSQVFLSFDELLVNVSLQSLFRLAPVVEELHLKKPYLHLARTGANHYNIDDILALIANQPPAKEPTRFSVYNIQIDNGSIDFDDQPEKTRHTVAELNLGIPFISSLPSYVDTFVEPYLNAKVNGSSLSLKGKVRPFAESKETVLNIDVADIDLPQYLEYLPFEPRFKLRSGKLNIKMQASFRQRRDQAPALVLTGGTSLKSVVITQLDGKPMVKLPELAITLGEMSVLDGNFDIAKIVLTEPELHVVTEPGGAINLAQLAPPSSDKPAARAGETSAENTSTLNLRIQVLAVKDGTLKYENPHAAQPLQAAVEKFNLAVTGIDANLQKREASLGEVTSDSAHFNINHLKAGKHARTTKASAGVASRAGSSDSTPFAVSIAKVSIKDWTAKLEDHSPKKPAITLLSPISLSMQNISTKPGSKGTLDLKARVNEAGNLDVNGTLALSPLQADMKLHLKEVGLLGLQPYFTEQLNLLITSANLSTSGSLQLAQARDGTLKGDFKGDLSLGKVATVDKLTANDFVRWKSLSINGVQARIDPFSLSVDRVALNDFFARIIVSKEGRLNLQDIIRAANDDKKSLTESAPDENKPAARWDTPPIGQGNTCSSRIHRRCKTGKKNVANQNPQSDCAGWQGALHRQLYQAELHCQHAGAARCNYRSFLKHQFYGQC